MTKKPKVGTPYRWRKKRVLEVPETGNPHTRCHGCIAEHAHENEKDYVDWIGLCEVTGKHDCTRYDNDGDPLENQGHIFIRDTHQAIVEYIARRLE